MNNVVGDVDELRSQRDARKNPPQFEAGQGDDSDWSFFDNEQSSSSMDESSFRGSNDLLLNSSDLSSLNGGVSKEQMAKNMTAQEDKIIDAFITVCKLLFGWSRDLVLAIKDGFNESDSFFWTVFGKRVLYIGFYIFLGGVVFSVLGLFTEYFSGGFWASVGGIMSMLVGVLIFAFNYEKSDNVSIENDTNKTEVTPSEEVVDEDIWGSFQEDDEEPEYIEDDSDVFSAWNFDDIEEDTEEVQISGVYEEDINIDSAIDNIREIPAHTQTRQYLFEEYSKVLPLKNPEFSKLKLISENDNNFIIFDKILTDAAVQVGTKEDKLPELLELRENSFIIQLKSTRPSGLKEDDIANEIANIYSRDEFGGIASEGVYATTSSVGSSFIINIFKGENSLVTLADTYREVKDFVLDPKVRKPIIIGVNELGRVWKFDADNIFSFIISGKPRSGKSWTVVSLVLQLCMYSSPREVIFEVFDVKGTSSDYYKMNESIPHFKRFESNKDRILSRLRYLTTTEADRRKKILKDNDSIAIADLKKKGLDVDIPYLYVIIDEIVGLTGTFSKEESSEFKDLMNTLITQMPNLGIKLILVPHRVTNDIVPKTTYVNVGCIACVRSEISEISNTLGVTKKDFPYDLSNSGDMALKTGEVNRGKTVFCHGIAVTSSNDGNEGIYKYLGSLWNKLEPESKEALKSSKGEEVYKGHNLSGVDDLLNDEDLFASDENIDEDFWKDVLGE